MPSTEANEQQPHPGYLRVTWDEVHHLVNNLYGQMEATGYAKDCENILAVARGGLVPARLLAACFEAAGQKVPIRYITIESYEGMKAGKLTVTQPTDHNFVYDLNKRSTLVIDDLWDTGNTFMFLKEILPQAAFTVLMSKKQEANCQLSFLPWASPKDIKKWVVFPWEEPVKVKNPSRVEIDFYSKAMRNEHQTPLTVEQVKMACELWDEGNPMTYIHGHMRRKFEDQMISKEQLRAAIFGEPA